MESQQLRLFPPARPFLELLGRQFFLSAPRKPGIYLMRDNAERVLYVGQSKNLRQRLGSYRYLQPEKTSRKIIRLLHSVDKVSYEECESAEAALLRENELIAGLRPKFNTANVYPPAYRYIHFALNDDKLILKLSGEPAVAGETYGAFKTGCIQVFASLLRALWTAAFQPRQIDNYPCFLLAQRPVREFEFQAAAPVLVELWHSLRRWLAGLDNSFSDLLAPRLKTACESNRFLGNLLATDFQAVNDFFHATRKNREMRERFELETSYIPLARLNELLLKSRSRKTQAGP